MTTPPQASFIRHLLFWSISFIAIPIAGYLGTLVVGRVDDVLPAIVGGAVVGLLVGIAQSIASRGRLSILRWSAATMIGLGLGVGAGTLVVGYQTTLPDLAFGGAITGTVVGAAQALALPAATRLRWIWIPVTAVLWPLAWTITTLAGIRVDLQFIVFGASGAIVYTVLAGAALSALIRRAPAATSSVVRDAAATR